MTTITPIPGADPGLPVSIKNQISDLGADAGNIAILLDLAIENIGTSPEDMQRVGVLAWTARDIAEQIQKKMQELEVKNPSILQAVREGVA